MTNLLNSKEMKKVMQVSLGQEKADLVITDGEVVSVYSGEFLSKHSVAIKGKWIAYVGPDAHHTIGPETKVLDASNKVLIPGLIDGHAHMIYYSTPDEIIRYAMKGGTTTIITETLELIFALGYSGLVEMLDALRNQPIKVFATVPPSMTISEGARKKGPTLEQLLNLLQREEVVGVGEGFWQEVIRGEQNFPALSEESLRLKKTVEGHAAGCRAEKLAAYLAFGVSSCHESISVEEVLEKLRLGMCVMIREGSIRKELEVISKIKNMRIDFRRLALVSDGVDPRELIKTGYMDYVVQRAIDLGFDPITAIQMATLNTAEHFGLDSYIGGIAPGKHGDILIIPDVRTIKPEYVISNGHVVAQDEKVLVKPGKINLTQRGPKGIRVSRSNFRVGAEGESPLKVRVIDQVSELVTREIFLDISPQDNELKADPEHDLLKVSLINWEGKMFTGLIRGLGIKAGAFATSSGWETFAIIVGGVNEEDMALAANRVSELGGGIVLYNNRKLEAELPLPIGGIISNLPIEEVAQKLELIQEKAKELGFRFGDAPLTFATLTSPAIPFIRISEDGLVDVKKSHVVDLIVR
jgi:adenine deaminase